MIRYHRSPNHKQCQLRISDYVIFLYYKLNKFILKKLISLALYEKSKSLGSGGSMVASLKLKEIDGRAPPGVEPAA